MPYGPFASFTECMERFTGHVEDPAAFCKWLGQEHGWSEHSESAKSHELTGPIVHKNAVKQIAYAAVLVPGETDSQGEPPLSKDEIERVAHEWMAVYRNIDVEHTLNNVNMVPVESYLQSGDRVVTIEGRDTILPDGTWIMAAKATDAAIWEGIENGQYTGFSVMGVRRADLQTTLKSLKDSWQPKLLKPVLIADLGDDWVAPFVSIVGHPAVPKAKWFALKSKEGLVERVRSLFNGRPQSPAAKTEQEVNTMEKDEIRQFVQEAVKGILDERDTEASRAAEKQAHEDRMVSVEQGLAQVQDSIKALTEAQDAAGKRIDGLTGSRALKSDGEEDGQEPFWALVDAYVAEKGGSKVEAIKAVRKSHPDVADAYFKGGE